MAVACFLKTMDNVENLGNDMFRVTLTCSLMDTSNSQFSMTFDAQKGADWGIQGRIAVAQWVLEHLGETVDLLVLPNLETI